MNILWRVLFLGTFFGLTIYGWLKQASLASSGRRLDAIDKSINPILELVNAERKNTMLVSRMMASLQLAYRVKPQCVRFYDGGSWAIGIFECMTEDNHAGQFLTVYIHLLKHQSPHMYLDNHKNNRLFRRDLPFLLDRAQLVPCEGYISSRYSLYAPHGYAIDSLVVAAPDVLDAIDQLNLGSDVELLGDQLYMIFPGVIKLSEMLPDIVKNGQKLTDAVEDNLSRYKDERAISIGQPIGYEGRRLIRK